MLVLNMIIRASTQRNATASHSLPGAIVSHCAQAYCQHHDGKHRSKMSSYEVLYLKK